MMSKLGVFLARQELTTVYNHFDANKDGNICFEEFIGTLRVSRKTCDSLLCLTMSFLARHE